MSFYKFSIEAIILLILYFIMPEGYDRNISFILVLFYIYQIISLFRVSVTDGNFLSFNVVFFAMYSLCTYFVPLLHLFGMGAEINTFIAYDDKYLNPALLLSSFAVACYSLGYKRGSLKSQVRYFFRPLGFPILNLKNVLVICKVLIFSLTFFLIVSFETIVIPGTNDVQPIFVTIINVVYILSIVVCGYSNIYFKLGLKGFFIKHKIVIICVLIIVLEFLSLGDRTIPISLLLSLLFVYNTFVKTITGCQLAMMFLLGLFFLFLIGFARNATSGHSIGDTLDVGIEQMAEQENLLVILQDVLPANLDMYLGLEWADNNNNLYFPGRVFIYLLAPLPFIPSLLTNMFYGESTIMNISSAMLLTKYNQALTNTSNGAGIGTHVVVDVYLSWGLLGIFLLFMIYGYIIGYLNVAYKYNFLCLVLYLSIFANAVYIPRGSIFSGYREAVYSLLLYLLIKTLLNSKNYHHE